MEPSNELINIHLPTCEKCGRPRIECWCEKTHPITPKLPEICIVGNCAPGKSTLIAAMSQILGEKAMQDIIIIDESNVGEIQRQLLANKEERTFALENCMRDLSEIEPIKYADMPYKKNRKPNTGMQIGSYRFKSKK